MECRVNAIPQSIGEVQAPIGPPPLLDVPQQQQISRQGYLLPDLKPELLKILTDLSTAASLFFEKPIEEKRQAYPQVHGTELGYYEVPGEKEYVTLRHSSASSLIADTARGNADIESNAAELWRQTALLMHRILAQLSANMNIKLEAWDPVLDGCLSLPKSQDTMTPTLLRMFKYLPGTGGAEEHRDLGLLTLCAGTGKGLQIWDSTTPAGRWVDAEGPAILTGRTMAYLTNGRVPAALHRVVVNPEGRTSIVFALRPSIGNKVPLTPFGGWGSLQGFELWALIKDNVRNINATHDVQERQRKGQQERARRAEMGRETRPDASRHGLWARLCSRCANSWTRKPVLFFVKDSPEKA